MVKIILVRTCKEYQSLQHNAPHIPCEGIPDFAIVRLCNGHGNVRVDIQANKVCAVGFLLAVRIDGLLSALRLMLSDQGCALLQL